MILKNVAIYFAKLVPNRPDRYDPNKPAWTLQIRTTDKAVKKAWQDMNLNVKTVDPDEGEIYYKVSLKKKITNREGKPAQPVEVIGNGIPIDPSTIGNGTIANLRLYQYQYPATKENPKGGIATMLQGVQITRHVVYRSTREEFEDAEYEAVESDPDASNDAFEKAPAAKRGPVDEHDDVAF